MLVAFLVSGFTNERTIIVTVPTTTEIVTILCYCLALLVDRLEGVPAQEVMRAFVGLVLNLKKGDILIMDVSQAIRIRRSIRVYQEKEIEKEKLDEVLEAARLAPSANNRQEWKFIVVKDKDTREKLVHAASDQTFIGQAPIVIAACATESQSIMTCGQPRYTVDVSIAMSFMILQARELGLGTCWIGAFNESVVKEILDIPDDIRVVAITPLGYPVQEPAARPRKAMEQIVCFDKYE